MLHYETVHPGTLGLLKKLMRVPELSGFDLVGGTALALQIGHRISVDLDFFGKVGPLNHFVLESIASEFGQVEVLTSLRNIFSLNIDGIKVDFVNYQYPLLVPAKNIDDLRLAAVQDIAAMKLSAITGRGRKRDFVDLYFLMQSFPLEKIIGFYSGKYPGGNTFLVMKSLTYFEDAEDDQDLVLLKKVKWEEVKNTIFQEAQKIMRG